MVEVWCAQEPQVQFNKITENNISVWEMGVVCAGPVSIKKAQECLNPSHLNTWDMFLKDPGSLMGLWSCSGFIQDGVSKILKIFTIKLSAKETK